MSGYIGTQPVPQATQTRDVFTATSGQTTFATAGYTPNFLDVWLNGVKLVNGDDFTATNGSDVVLTSGAAVGDTVEVLSYSTYEVNAQTYTGGLTVNNDAATVLTVDRATSDGTLVDFKKDNEALGRVDIYGNAVIRNFLDIRTAASVGSGIGGNDGYLQVFDKNGTSDAVVDLGSASSRIKSVYLSGGVYLGGTGAANLLDDYEEGTWTPILGGLSSVTYSLRTGSYRKVGSMVFAFWDLRVTASSGSFDSRLGGLPFTVSPNMAGYSIVNSRDSTLFNSNGITYGQLKGYAEKNAIHLQFQVDASTTSSFGTANVFVGFNGTGRSTGYVIYEAT